MCTISRCTSDSNYLFTIYLSLAVDCMPVDCKLHGGKMERADFQELIMLVRFNFERDGYLCPTVISMSDKGYVITPLRFQSRDMKFEECKGYSMALRKLNCQWYAFISEATRTELTTGKKDDIISVLMEDINGKQFGYYGTIENKKIAKEEWDYEMKCEVMLFDGIFPKKAEVKH